MSASSKFDFTPDSPDRMLFALGHRGSYGAPTVDGSASLHENMENPLLSNLPNMTRSSSSVMRGDVLNFFQCLRFDPKSVVVKHKLNRPAEFRRLSTAAVGLPLEDSLSTSSKNKQLSSFSLEDLRQLKAGARESGTKARERVKILNDCLLAINKCFPTIPSRKRSRLDALSNTLLSNDRSSCGMNVGKPGPQKYASTSGSELDHRKYEEKNKNATTSKRTRTSVVDKVFMDVLANTPARQSGTFDKDRDIVRQSSSSIIQGEDQTLSVSVGCWEKSKTKKKRTSIKPAASASLSTKPFGYKEHKQGMLQRISTEARSRLGDVHGFRSATSNGGVGVGKAETISQMNSGIRVSISVTDTGNSSTVHERRDRPNSQERVNLKSVKKANSREDSSSRSPPGPKLNANVRAPRSALVSGVSKSSQGMQPPSSNDWEPSNCTRKIPAVFVPNNRKNTLSTQFSSPSVANWVQRPQKISRTARRTNLLPIISGSDENPVTVATPELVTNERRFSASSPRQIKIKSENFSPSAVSEKSEESGATELKSKIKKKKGSEIVETSSQNVQQMSTLLLPPRKNNSGDDHGDGIRRQGRSNRLFTSSRSFLPLSGQKSGSVGTTKQVRSSRLCMDKNERSGRPPTRKLSDKKAYTRQKHIPINSTADFLVSPDGHEDLLAAVKSVTDTVSACSSPFWKKMEALFHFLCDADISYLKEKVNIGSVVDMSVPDLLDANSSTFQPNGNKFGREECGTRNVEISPEHSVTGANEISLYQRLIAALIPEENEEFFDFRELNCDPYGTRCMDKDMDPNVTEDYLPEHAEREGHVATISDSGYDILQNELISEACSENQYNNMSMNERLLMEVHSIGICSNIGCGDEISENIYELLEKYQEQVTMNKGLHIKLLNYVSEAKELQEREFERHALDKLTGMAYEKYMCCWGPNAHGMKSATAKKAKQAEAALAFVNRALKLYKEFEATGKSCFNEPLYRETFVSGASRLVDEMAFTCITDDESAKLHARKYGCSVEVRTSAHLGISQSPSNNQEVYSSEVLGSSYLASEPNADKEDGWSNRVKRRELSLCDVGVTVSISPGRSNGLGGSLAYSAKGKMSEREREGKGREALARSGNTKSGPPVSTTVKGDRKSEAKLKQKTAHSHASLNGPLGKMYDQPKVDPPVTNVTDIGKDKNNNHDLDMLEEPIDLSGLQLPDMEGLGDPNGPTGQGEDIGSWLNFEDDGLQDHDYMGGLGIPTDDLADLNMMA